ncbi:outer membrane protein assembly factor BamB family protein [Anaeromyxobacter terrae]|uniref:outer membrane protein assembly factor BamB family protein n=1 Tax=Anaeromyxobacter terrae TaxID=2925406 RepID=UPI001F574E2C|nr:PQQ-binding-like beta-propeller repeat protein [Anaeromyxobacter sp. SG22]
MIRIRTGASWKHDPGLTASLRRAEGPARVAAARAVVDALAIEVDGIDIAAGRAEGALLPSLEALLRAIARVVGGEAHAAVPFRDGELELVIRRRGSSALLTVVTLSRPSRVLARDVEVEVDALAAAALEAAAAFCRELGEILPEEAAREGRRLRAAARAIRRAEAPAPGPREGGRTRAPRTAGTAGRITCTLELSDEEGHLLAYEGGRPDLGSLLVPGRLTLRGADGTTLAVFPGIPFLALRDLGAGVDRLLAAFRRGEPRCEIALARPGRGGVTTLVLDLREGQLIRPEGRAPCPPLELARALAEAAVELGHVARARNPRQAENAHLADLESAAAERLAHVEELAEGDRPADGLPGAEQARAPSARAPSQRPLGPGQLRRLAFRRVFELDVGAPAGTGLHVRGGMVLSAGRAAVAAVERNTGRVLWRAPGAAHAAVLPGTLLLSRGGALEALALRTGRALWTQPLPGPPAFAALAFARGPFLVVGGGALTALDPSSGRTLWRLLPPGAGRLSATAFGGIVAVGADTGFVYGVDGTGRVVWRVRGPGPVVRPPAALAGLALVLCAVDSGVGAVAVALDPAGGARRWEARLDLVPSGPPIAWGRRLAIAGALAGDPIVATLDEAGAPAWSVVAPLAGPPAIAAAGALLVARDPAGGVVALGRDGAVRWSRPAPAGAPAPGAVPPAIARGTVIAAAADGVAALDARTGEIVGAIPGVAPVRVAVDATLGLALMDADGLVTGYRVATHLSLVA